MHNTSLLKQIFSDCLQQWYWQPNWQNTHKTWLQKKFKPRY